MAIIRFTSSSVLNSTQNPKFLVYNRNLSGGYHIIYMLIPLPSNPLISLTASKVTFVWSFMPVVDYGALIRSRVVPYPKVSFVIK
jgi:hypothetical protein